jgi:type I restriction enzyme S subunit
MAEAALCGANVTRGIVPIRFDPKHVSQRLGYYLLQSEQFQAQIRAKTYGTALMQINIGDLRKIVLTCPPIDRQADLVETLDAVQDAGDQLVAIYDRKLTALADLKKSLLHQAFTGQLTGRKAESLAEAVA